MLCLGSLCGERRCSRLCRLHQPAQPSRYTDASAIHRLYLYVSQPAGLMYFLPLILKSLLPQQMPQKQQELYSILLTAVPFAASAGKRHGMRRDMRFVGAVSTATSHKALPNSAAQQGADVHLFNTSNKCSAGTCTHCLSACVSCSFAVCHLLAQSKGEQAAATPDVLLGPGRAVSGAAARHRDEGRAPGECAVLWGCVFLRGCNRLPDRPKQRIIRTTRCVCTFTLLLLPYRLPLCCSFWASWACLEWRASQ